MLDGSGIEVGVKVPIGNAEVAVALEVAPSRALIPENVQLLILKVEPSGPVSSTRYAQPSSYSQGCPVPSVSMSPNTSTTTPLSNNSIASSPLTFTAVPDVKSGAKPKKLLNSVDSVAM